MTINTKRQPRTQIQAH